MLLTTADIALLAILIHEQSDVAANVSLGLPAARVHGWEKKEEKLLVNNSHHYVIQQHYLRNLRDVSCLLNSAQK